MWLAVIIVLVLLIVGYCHFEHFTDFADKVYNNALITKRLNWGVGSAAALNYGAHSAGGWYQHDERNEDDDDDDDPYALRTPGGMHVSA